MSRTKHLTLSEATEEQIEEMNETGSVELPEEETKDDAENRGSGKAPKDPVTFSLAYPVETLGRLIVDQNYPALKHQRIVYVFQSETPKVDGNEVPIVAKKLAGFQAWLGLCYDGSQAQEGEAPSCFVLLVSQKMWDLMGQKSREAMLDEALWQCDVSESTGSIRIRKFDVKTSVEVLHRRGLYTNKLKDMGQVAKRHIEQPALLEEAS